MGAEKKNVIESGQNTSNFRLRVDSATLVAANLLERPAGVILARESILKFREETETHANQDPMGR